MRFFLLDMTFEEAKTVQNCLVLCVGNILQKLKELKEWKHPVDYLLVGNQPKVMKCNVNDMTRRIAYKNGVRFIARVENDSHRVKSEEWALRQSMNNDDVIAFVWLL